MKKEWRIPNKLIAFFVVLITIINVISYISVYQATVFPEPPALTALISYGGTITLCLNKAPAIIQACNQTATVNVLYTCDVNVNDSDIISAAFSDNTTIFTINSGSGLINFTPASGNAGRHSINISVNDNSGCSNSQDSSILNLNVSSAGGGGSGTGSGTEGGSGRQWAAEETPGGAGGGGAGGGGGEPGGQGAGGEAPGGAEAPEQEGIGVEGGFIKISLKPGESQEKVFAVTNSGDSPLSIKLTVNGAKDIVAVDTNELTLAPKESKTIELSYDAYPGLEPGVYSGELVMDSADFSESVPIVVNLQSEKALYETDLYIPPEFKEVKQGEKLEFFGNIGRLTDRKEGITADGKEDITYDIYIKDSKDKRVYFTTESIKIGKDAYFSGSVGIPKNLAAGIYVLAVAIKSLDSVSIASTIFEVSKSAALELPKGSQNLALIDYMPYINLLIIVLSIILILVVYRHHNKYQKNPPCEKAPSEEKLENRGLENKKELENKGELENEEELENYKGE